MKIKKIVVGPLQVNCYILMDEINNKAVLIDPGDEPEIIIDFIRKENLDIEFIICTHAHFDHVGALPDIKREANARIAIHKDELGIYKNVKNQAEFLGYELEELPEPDLFLNDGDDIKFGESSLKIMLTPGHSPGSICLYGESILMSGDTLFAGSVGRTDFHGGDIGKLKKSFSRLMALPPDTKVFPGHGPSTSIQKEKDGNFFNW